MFKHLNLGFILAIFTFFTHTAYSVHLVASAPGQSYDGFFVTNQRLEDGVDRSILANNKREATSFHVNLNGHLIATDEEPKRIAQRFESFPAAVIVFTKRNMPHPPNTLLNCAIDPDSKELTCHSAGRNIFFVCMDKKPILFFGSDRRGGEQCAFASEAKAVIELLVVDE